MSSVRSNEYGDKPAIIAFGKDQPAIWSFADLLDDVQRLASGLAQRGMAPGTRVVPWAPNRPERDHRLLGSGPSRGDSCAS